MRRRWWAWAALGLILAALLAVGARTTPTEGASDDRLFALASQMRCMACAGESVSNSQAPLAVEMRGVIRSQMRKGMSDDEILTYFADRYGKRVLLNPAGSGFAALVWIVPVLVAAAAVVGLGFVFSRARRAAEVPVEVTEEDLELVRRAREERARGSAR